MVNWFKRLFGAWKITLEDNPSVKVVVYCGRSSEIIRVVIKRQEYEYDNLTLHPLVFSQILNLSENPSELMAFLAGYNSALEEQKRDQD